MIAFLLIPIDYLFKKRISSFYEKRKSYKCKRTTYLSFNFFLLLPTYINLYTKHYNRKNFHYISLHLNFLKKKKSKLIIVLINFYRSRELLISSILSLIIHKKFSLFFNYFQFPTVCSTRKNLYVSSNIYLVSVRCFAFNLRFSKYQNNEYMFFSQDLGRVSLNSTDLSKKLLKECR